MDPTGFKSGDQNPNVNILLYIRDEILPSYTGIIMDHHKGSWNMNEHSNTHRIHGTIVYLPTFGWFWW